MKLSVLFVAIILSIHSASAQSSFTSSEIKTVQQKLSDSGYDVGTVDGKYGRKTTTGIRQYQTDWKLPRTGKIDRVLIDRLEQKHPDTMPRWQKVENQNCEVWNSKPQAQVTATWTGRCAEGKVTGTGRFVWSYLLQGQTHKNTYEGEFRDGKPHGDGEHYYSSDGEIMRGSWRHGCLSANGKNRAIATTLGACDFK